MEVILSIKSEFVEKIISCEKKYEFRKKIFKRGDISTVVIYETKPVGKIIGEFKVEKIIEESPLNLWEATKDFAGISKKKYLTYFQEASKAYALKISEFKEYNTPLEINEFDSTLSFAPQSFCYSSPENQNQKKFKEGDH